MYGTRNFNREERAAQKPLRSRDCVNNEAIPAFRFILNSVSPCDEPRGNARSRRSLYNDVSGHVIFEREGAQGRLGASSDGMSLQRWTY